MDIILYGSAQCPRCKVLEMKLVRKGISYTKELNEEKILEKGLKSIPWLETEDGQLLDFKAANDWINNYQEVNE